MLTAIVKDQQLAQYLTKKLKGLQLHTLIRVDVLVVLALLSLRAWSKDRTIRDSFTLLQARRNFDAMHGTRLLVLLPRRPGNVTTDNSLNGQDIELPHLHTPVLEHWPEGVWDLRREVEGKEVCAQGRDGL